VNVRLAHQPPAVEEQHFDDVLRGVDSIAIHYKGITGTHVVEVLFFDRGGLVRESYVHYAS
jgi:hypothetical protein